MVTARFYNLEFTGLSRAMLYQSGQARFFNHVDAIASTWGAAFEMQLQAITDDDGLTLARRRVMQAIGDYSHWGVLTEYRRSASPTALDYHLLEKHGSIEALREAGLCGVADRLESEHNDRAAAEIGRSKHE